MPPTPLTYFFGGIDAKNGHIFAARIRWYARIRFPPHGSRETEDEPFVVSDTHSELLVNRASPPQKSTCLMHNHEGNAYFFNLYTTFKLARIFNCFFYIVTLGT